MSANFQRKQLLKAILDQFKISRNGVHGPAHWARVRYHGLMIGAECGADLHVVELFAFLHDSKRLNEYSDPDHGARAADYATSLNGSFFTLNAKANILVLDDWGLAAFDDHSRRDLLEIFDDRYKSHSTIVTSQLPVDVWHDAIGDPTLADAILDRLVHNAHRINLRGKSMRTKLTAQEKEQEEVKN